MLSHLHAGAESCLLCCQPEPSLRHYLPDYYELLHHSFGDCKLKGDGAIHIGARTLA